MNFSGETLIAASREKVWEALNDPAVLKACIPGCDALTPTDAGGFAAAIRQKIGPVSATFEGEVTIEDPDPPHRYRLVGKGSGGVAGFAKGSALVTLTETAEGTSLRYDAEAQLGGKIAQLGGRLISGVAEKLAADFFAAFGRQVTGEPAAIAKASAPAALRKLEKPRDVPLAQAGPGWKLFALSGWSTAIFLATLLLLERIAALR